jgi:hypothetical protein
VNVRRVESRMGAVAWAIRPTPRFPPPLIKPGRIEDIESAGSVGHATDLTVHAFAVATVILANAIFGGRLLMGKDVLASI